VEARSPSPAPEYPALWPVVSDSFGASTPPLRPPTCSLVFPTLNGGWSVNGQRPAVPSAHPLRRHCELTGLKTGNRGRLTHPPVALPLLFSAHLGVAALGARAQPRRISIAASLWSARGRTRPPSGPRAQRSATRLVQGSARPWITRGVST
jgi:hypothetical protein